MTTQTHNEDEAWMQRALRLAEKGVGTTSPNPPVGAVIVKDGCVIGEGYHERAGEAHAERRAIQDALRRGNDLREAAIYVTLEPCSSHGRTPPCTDAILSCGISRVVYGAVDPDKRHRGRADALLRAAGLEVCGRVAEDACRAFLRPWMHSVETGRPWVTAKIASTLDGRIVRRTEKWLSCEDSLKYAHQLRLESDAILVGGNTVRKDNPSLTIRHPLNSIPACKQQPWRIVMTRDHNTLPSEAALFTDNYSDRTLVLENVSDIKAMLEEIHSQHGVTRLMLECGGRLLRMFLEMKLVNEWVQIITPYLGGGDDMLLPGAYLPTEQNLANMQAIHSGRDIILRGELT